MADKCFKNNLMGKISKIRIATFKKNNPSNMSVKYSMDKSAKSSQIDILSKPITPLMPYYESILLISNKKYDDLAKLCKDKVIPVQFHQ